MKRHPSLHPLSHDHHHGLVLSRRLQKASPDDAPEVRRNLARQVQEMWLTELHGHFRDEEDILMPALARQGDQHWPAILDTLRQHVDLRRRIDDLERALEAEVAPDAAALDALGRALQQHIRFEEDVVFPALEAALDEQELARLAPRLLHDRA
jgi:iron-sulfur cluster repair protein YtfE (RIC family)